jgi:hypothetical protein
VLVGALFKKFGLFLSRVVFGSKRDGITGEWSRLHIEELNDLYSSPNIMRMMKSRRMGWDGHVARVEERRGVYRVWCGNLEGDHLEDLGVDGRIILKLIMKKSVGSAWAGLIWLGAGFCESGNKPLGTVKCGEYVN